MASLLDLLPIAKESVALPVPGYSLKVIEKYVHRATSCTRTQVEIDVSFSCPSASIRGTARADGREDFVRPELGSHGEVSMVNGCVVADSGVKLTTSSDARTGSASSFAVICALVASIFPARSNTVHLRI